nr:RAMP superfamily CRISPR-associated protein [Candidatus Baldrarchaeota archaeon]
MFDFTIKINFITLKKLHISSSIPIKIVADNPFMETISERGEKVKIIPASTIKGVLRSSLIKISRALGFNVTPSVNPEKIRDKNDIVTAIFGKPGGDFSKISIENAYYKGDTQVYTHVKIDEETGIAEEGGLFSREYIPIGEKFSTKIICKNLSVEETRALLAALVNLRFEGIGRNSFVNVTIEDVSPKEILERLEKDEIIHILLDTLRRQNI